MEEVRSTEVLDKEILEDARKRAYRILKAAEEVLIAQSTEWEKRENAALAELRQKYAVRTEITKNEIMARLPLDKKRMYSKAIESLLQSAMVQYLNTLNREQQLLLLKSELDKQIAFCVETGEFEDDEFALQTGGLVEAEAEAILKDVLPPGTWTIIAQSELPGECHFPVLVFSTTRVHIKASVERIATDLLQNRRVELITALLGNSAYNG
jgi:vacuolar-type H+-ATPase subunit E/Vma4